VETTSGENGFQRRATGIAQTRGLSEYVPPQAVHPEDVERVVGRIKRELSLLLQERAAIAKRIRSIQNTIAGLADVFAVDIGDEELWDVLPEQSAHRKSRHHRGITDACRRALMEFSQPVTTHQLCDKMQETSTSILARQKQPTTSVTVVLRRLVSYGEVQDSFNERNVRTWLWIGSRQCKEAFEASRATAGSDGR